MDELYLLGMDIAEELKTMAKVTVVTCTDGMTDSELKAYVAGVENTISALRALLDDDLPIVNIAKMEIPTELTIDEITDYYESL